ncbi:nuclear transport factor 2 family protein [Saccharomonospora piscinae]|uniref:nuclear transport factor 2 family protein n=1 Tax=Saccharomonospora piscinae TaxID=687388 RepID=UPI00110736A5|nr:nuclear transport factor 2 family protein [Saccharomonospora piscinae]TLW91688.1 nuclear transport factor 2 family protein [Saccharomonospora piscinae]
MNDIVERYLATWNAVGADRAHLLASHWSASVTYVDPLAAVRGHSGVGAMIDEVHAQFPGFVFTQLGEVDAHHQQLRFRWGLGPEGDEPVVIGFDVVVLDEDGRIHDVRGFLDKVPA